MWERRSDSCASFVNGKPIVLIPNQYYSIGVHVLFFTAHQNSQTKLRQQLRSKCVLCNNPFTTQHVDLNFSFFTLPSPHSDFNLFDLSPFSSFYSLCQVSLALLFLGFVFFISRQFLRFLVRHLLYQSKFDWFHFLSLYCLTLVLLLWSVCSTRQYSIDVRSGFEEICREKIVSTIHRALVLDFDTVGDRMRFLHLYMPFFVFRFTSSAFLFRYFLLPQGNEICTIEYNFLELVNEVTNDGIFFLPFFGLIWCSSISVYLHFEIIINDTISTYFPFEIDCCWKAIQFWQSYYVLSSTQKCSELLIGFCTINEWLSFFPPNFSGDCGGFEVKWKPFTC